MERLRGLRHLVHDAIERTTNLVERTQESVTAKYVDALREIEPIARPVETVDEVRRLTAAGVYATIRAVNEGVRQLGDLGHDAIAAGVGERATPDAPADDAAPAERAEAGLASFAEAAQGALNGFIGDFLRERDNALEIPMHFRRDGRALELEAERLARLLTPASSKLCVFVHGLGCTEKSWGIGAERFWGDSGTSFAKLLERDLGYTCVHVRYNTGLHVSENGRALARGLADLVATYPRDIEEIVLIGHSMGGLVARSAAHYGAAANEPWVTRLRHVFCLGSPHQGAPLEQVTHVIGSVLRAFDTPGTQIPADILELRSAGVKDMRFGYVLDEEWRDQDPDALLANNRKDAPFIDGVAYYFVAATITRDPAHPMGHLLGDLLTRPASASGHAAEPARRVPFRIGRVFGGMGHLHLANHPDVYEQIRAWLA